MDKSNRALVGISSAHFILDLYAAILIPLYPMIATKLDINIATISLVIAISHSLCSFLQPIFGYISDNANKRIFILMGIIFCSIFFPVAIYSPNAVILTICLIFGIMGNAFFHPQSCLILKENTINHTKSMGIFLGLGTIGYSFGPYLSTFVLETFKEQNYIYIALIGLIMAIFVYFFVPKIKEKENKLEYNFKDGLKEIIKNKICLFLVLVAIIKSALIMSFGTYIPFLLRKYDIPTMKIGLIMTLFFVMGGLSMIISSKIEKYIKLKGLIVASFLPILPLVLFSLYFLNINKIFAIILIITIGFFILLQAGAVLAHAQNIVKSSGTISGIIQGLSLAIGSLLLIPFGIIAQNLNIEYVLILISIVAFIIGTIANRLDFGKE